ncbi:DUF4244 domain-containing protein [Streptomyces diastaticus]|uniref:DUF4244 domain-containing protein n=1 Tax=Streptomyces diastaticus group TaxID=2849069 RepID=UPI001623C1C3|nr:DUF4244 domain-containing protein [Streptomyces rutgersensis]
MRNEGAGVRSAEMSGSGMCGSGTSGCETEGAVRRHEVVEGAVVTAGRRMATDAREGRPAEDASSAGRGAGDVAAGAPTSGGAGDPVPSSAPLPVPVPAPVPGRALARLRAREAVRLREGAGEGSGTRDRGQERPVRLLVVPDVDDPRVRVRDGSRRSAGGPGRRRAAGRGPGARGGEGARRHRRPPRERARRDAGMATSEYAMALLAAVAFAGVLYKIVTGGAVASALQSAVEKALDAPF